MFSANRLSEERLFSPKNGPVPRQAPGSVSCRLFSGSGEAAKTVVPWRHERTMTKYILALDQGTTSSRAIVFGRERPRRGQGATGVPADSARPGHRRARSRGDLGVAVGRGPAGAGRRPGSRPSDIAAIGVTNQRETTILWDRETGRPVANAIVWQSRVSAAICERLKADGLRAAVSRRRPAWCSTPISPAPRSSTCSIARRLLRDGAARGRHPLRHGRYLADLAAERRPAARDRLQQCQPHAAVQHPHARLGRRTAAASRYSPGDAARGAPVERSVWPDEPTSGSAARSRWPATPATSRRPRSARPVSRPAAPRTPTARAAFC